MRRVGDVSRRRCFTDKARQKWYALHRSRRFACRCFETVPQVNPPNPVKSN
jgi:hypothetical protein